MKNIDYILIIVIIILLILVIFKNKEHLLASNESIAAVTSVYANTTGTASFNNLNVTGRINTNNIDICGNISSKFFTTQNNGDTRFFGTDSKDRLVIKNNGQHIFSGNGEGGKGATVIADKFCFRGGVCLEQGSMIDMTIYKRDRDGNKRGLNIGTDPAGNGFHGSQNGTTEIYWLNNINPWGRGDTLRPFIASADPYS
jgi:hypothetical protein